MAVQAINLPASTSGLNTADRRLGWDVLKRATDFVLALAMFLIAAPLVAGITLWLALSGVPVLCSREVLGRGGRSFRSLKFSTPCTAFGRLLRETALSELPRLLNVLRGDMSLVGPEAVPLDTFLAHYGGQAATAYLSVRPGITGLSQIDPRANTAARRAELDCRYVRERCFAGDLRLILRTAVLISGGYG